MTLREELTNYLEQHKLGCPSCEDGVLWKRFVKYLAGVIDETPLHCSLWKPKNKTNHVQSITVSRRRNYNGTAMLTWKALCYNPPPGGVETDIEVVLLPDFNEIALP